MSDVDSVNSPQQAIQNDGREREFLLRWVRRAVSQLREAEENINQLNVFPIPDADTGTNMVTTLSAALRHAEYVKASGMAETSAALASGAVRGARGNSGMALSQVLRAVALTSATRSWDVQAVAQCLDMAVGFVRDAMAEPVPGTILSVLEAAAEAAAAAVEAAGADSTPAVTETEGTAAVVAAGDALAQVVEEALAAARLALSRTTQCLDVLKRAGVVDAGGYGLVVILEALHAELRNARDTDQLVHVAEHTLGGHTTESTSLLEVMFTACGNVDKLKNLVETLGTSLVIAPFEKEDTVRIHIHTDSPGEVLEAAYRTTHVSDVHIEALPPSQHILIAIVPPGDLSQVFEDSGAILVPPGDEAPQKITEILRGVDADVLLQSNGLLTRIQLYRICAAHPRLRVLPTPNLVAGIAAQAVFDPHQPLNLVALSMTDAAASMVTSTIDSSPEGYVLHSAGAVDETFAQLHDAVTNAYRRMAVMRPVPPELLTVVVSPEVSESQEVTYTPETHSVFADADIIAYTSENGGHCVQIGVE